nr:unnamed protein product [Haemonchus contortus]
MLAVASRCTSHCFYASRRVRYQISDPGGIEGSQGAFDYAVKASEVDLTVTVTAYYNKYLNSSYKETATETPILIKNLKHVRNGEQIDLTWDVEGALPYEELEYVVR